MKKLRIVFRIHDIKIQWTMNLLVYLTKEKKEQIMKMK